MHTGQEVISLGLIRMNGSLPTERAVILIDQRLLDFGIIRKRDLVATTTDGASVMRKFGRLMDCQHQQCFAHALHLGVCDVLYEKPTQDQNFENDEAESANEGEGEEESEEDGDDAGIEEVNCEGVAPFSGSLKDIIGKARKIVKTFKYSPVKNDFLAQCCTNEGLNQTKLSLDIKIRWNSIVTMLRSLLRAWPAVKKALHEFSLTHLLLTEAEVKFLNGICDCLETVAAGATELGSRDMDLARADKIIEFILDGLNKGAIFINIGPEESKFYETDY